MELPIKLTASCFGTAGGGGVVVVAAVAARVQLPMLRADILRFQMAHQATRRGAASSKWASGGHKLSACFGGVRLIGGDPSMVSTIGGKR